MRYFAANETAGLAVFFVRASRRVPFPPARIIATTFLDITKLLMRVYFNIRAHIKPQTKSFYK